MRATKKSKKGEQGDIDSRLVFLFDVDNTLLDNDRSKKEMAKALG